jgi:uncharacterized DUF497 family protein
LLDYQWVLVKAAAYLNEHGVAFADAMLALADPRAVILSDSDAEDGIRFNCLGADPSGRILITCIYASRLANPKYPIVQGQRG